jgi:hypothetical protein
VERLLPSRFRVLVVRQHLRELVAKTATQLGSSPTIGRPARIRRAVCRACARGTVARGRGSRSRRAVSRSRRAARQRDIEARRLERLDGGAPDLRLEVVREGVRPEDDRASPGAGWAARANHACSVTGRTAAGGARRDPGGDLRERGEPGVCVNAFASRVRGRKSAPSGRSARTRRRARPQPAGVVVREDSALSVGMSTFDRAVVRAALAREAEVERLEHVGRVPSAELVRRSASPRAAARARASSASPRA